MHHSETAPKRAPCGKQSPHTKLWMRDTHSRQPPPPLPTAPSEDKHTIRTYSTPPKGQPALWRNSSQHFDWSALLLCPHRPAIRRHSSSSQRGRPGSLTERQKHRGITTRASPPAVCFLLTFVCCRPHSAMTILHNIAYRSDLLMRRLSTEWSWRSGPSPRFEQAANMHVTVERVACGVFWRTSGTIGPSASSSLRHACAWHHKQRGLWRLPMIMLNCITNPPMPCLGKRPPTRGLRGLKAPLVRGCAWAGRRR